jgi:pyruvate-formate lyase-activating enzyme
MVLTTYGRSSGFCVDPIEKKPLNHFYPGTSVLSFGTAGCNLGCRFCQNWDISKAREFDRLADQAVAGSHRRRRAPPGLPLRRLHLQRPGHLRRIRHGRGRRLPRGRGGGRGRHRGLHDGGFAPGILPAY